MRVAGAELGRGNSESTRANAPAAPKHNLAVALKHHVVVVVVVVGGGGSANAGGAFEEG